MEHFSLPSTSLQITSPLKPQRTLKGSSAGFKIPHPLLQIPLQLPSLPAPLLYCLIHVSCLSAPYRSPRTTLPYSFPSPSSSFPLPSSSFPHFKYNFPPLQPLSFPASLRSSFHVIQLLSSPAPSFPSLQPPLFQLTSGLAYMSSSNPFL